MKKIVASLMAAVSLVSASVAWAGQQDFQVHNHTGQAIMTLQVSPSGDAEWGADILGVDVLAADETGVVTFDRDEEACLWDIKVTYEDGDVGDWRQVNLCETTDINLTA